MLKYIYIYILGTQFCPKLFFIYKDIVFLSDNWCSFTTKHSLDKMTSTWIHIVSSIPYILLMFQFWCCLLSCRKVAKFRTKIYSISDFWIREKCKIAIFLLDSVFLKSTMEFLVLVSVKRGDTKTIVGKQLFSLNPDIFHDICEASD